MGQAFRKSQIDAFDHLHTIGKAVKQGVLLTTRWNDRVNTMTISWGQVGIEWNQLIFTALDVEWLIYRQICRGIPLSQAGRC